MGRTTLEQEILDYLVRHPRAQDTVDGIADWWLLEQRLRTVVDQVTRALEALEALGFVTSSTGADGRRVYRFNRRREAAARAWLEEGPGHRHRPAPPKPKTPSAAKSRRPPARSS